MQTKFSEDVVTLSALKADPDKIVEQATQSHRPVFLTDRGHEVAVVQGFYDYQNSKNELEFVRAIATGLMEVREGKIIELSDVKKELGI